MTSMGGEELFYGDRLYGDTPVSDQEDALVEISKKDLEQALDWLRESQEAFQDGSQSKAARLSMQTWMLLNKTKEGSEQ